MFTFRGLPSLYCPLSQERLLYIDPPPLSLLSPDCAFYFFWLRLPAPSQLIMIYGHHRALVCVIYYQGALMFLGHDRAFFGSLFHHSSLVFFFPCLRL